MKDHESHTEAAPRRFAAWVWVGGILLGAGILVVLLRRPAKWDLADDVYFPSGWALISILLLAAVAGAGIAAVLRRESEKVATESLFIPDGHPHPGITMHRLRVGGNAGGFIFAIGIVLICLVGIPTVWFFLALAIAAGLAVALFLHRRKALKIVTIGGEGNRPL
ncbi:MAG TPA: hypothetical protein VF532_07480 [Candidatus Angelobacter sp.]